MDTVCYGKQWDVALVFAPDGSVSAAMPYLLGSKAGLRYVLQPQLTQFNGPWFRPGTDAVASARFLAHHFRHLRLLFFQQCFAPAVSPLQGWEGFAATPRVTYRLVDISDPQQVFSGFDKQRRQRPLRRAAKLLTPVGNLSPEDFALFHARYWASRGQRDLLSVDFIVRIVQTALSRGQGLLLGLADSNGQLQAARFVAFDSRCAYSLLSALNPDGHANGASPLLFWHLIQHLSPLTRAFDFEGSMDPGIAFSYKLYGATPTTYYRLTRFCNPLVRCVLKSKIDN